MVFGKSRLKVQLARELLSSKPLRAHVWVPTLVADVEKRFCYLLV